MQSTMIVTRYYSGEQTIFTDSVELTIYERRDRDNKINYNTVMSELGREGRGR